MTETATRRHNEGSTSVLEEIYSGSTTTIAAASGWAADGLRSRYLPAAGFAYLFSYDPQGNLVQRQKRGSFTLGSWAYNTALYEAYGEAISFQPNHSPAHTNPVGFGGQWGNYTDNETGLLCLTQ